VYRFYENHAKPQDPDWRAHKAPLTGSARLQRKLAPDHKARHHDFQGRWHFNTCIAAIMELVNEIYVSAEEARPELLSKGMRFH
jgi:leucyl-tRNA synthetase